jgi:hypothetical protein
MVRSKGEAEIPTGREFFHLVERIRSEQKYFDISRDEIETELYAGDSCEAYCSHEMDDNGEVVYPELRLNVKRRKQGRRWSVALKLHDTRIDGIDFESKFDLPNGSQARGWHRHEWDAKANSAERLKIPLGDFGGEILSAEEFLIRAFSELRILLNSRNAGNSRLQFS